MTEKIYCKNCSNEIEPSTESESGWKHKTPEAAYACGHRGTWAEPEEIEE